STAPLSATITGSTTTGASPSSSRPSTTALIVGSSPSIPIFAASTPMSSATARIWSTIISRGTACTEVTPVVLCAVSATIAEVPCTPHAAKALRSAWIPAPPPESEPAIVIATGVRLSPVTRGRLARKRRALVAAAGIATDVAEKLEAGKRNRGVRSGQSALARDRIEVRRPSVHQLQHRGQLRLQAWPGSRFSFRDAGDPRPEERVEQVLT